MGVAVVGVEVAVVGFEVVMRVGGGSGLFLTSRNGGVGEGSHSPLAIPVVISPSPLQAL